MNFARQKPRTRLFPLPVGPQHSIPSLAECATDSASELAQLPTRPQSRIDFLLVGSLPPPSAPHLDGSIPIAGSFS